MSVTEALALLAVVYSRTFGVCVFCPRGEHLPNCGTLAAHWFDDPELGRFGVCEPCQQAALARKREAVA